MRKMKRKKKALRKDIQDEEQGGKLRKKSCIYTIDKSLNHCGKGKVQELPCSYKPSYCSSGLLSVFEDSGAALSFTRL